MTISKVSDLFKEVYENRIGDKCSICDEVFFFLGEVEDHVCDQIKDTKLFKLLEDYEKI